MNVTHAYHVLLWYICVLLLITNTFQQSAFTIPDIGANIDGITDYSRTIAFIDAVKSSRQFGTVQKPWETNGVVYDQNGWPNGDYGVVIHTSQIPGTINGTYLFECVGDATVALTATAGSMISQSKVNGKTTGSFRIDASADQIFITLSNTGTTGCKQLKVIRPGYTFQDAQTQVFTTEFLNILPFSTLRFMDWAITNNRDDVDTWNSRAKPTDAQWTIKGIPWEIIIDLGNRKMADIWINIPHKADDNYVTELAKLVRDTLNPSLHVYVEYSNEVWNWQFSQAHWNLNAAKLEGPLSDLNFDAVNNEGYWAWRRVGKRLKQISELFASQMGTAQRNTRFRCVLATQIANPETMRQPLHYVNQIHGNPSYYFYGVAGAPYFNVPDTANLSKEDVLQALNASIISMPQSVSYLVHVAYTKRYHLKYLAYEGGSDTFGGNSIQAKKQATLDPKMKILCIDYLKQWFSYGFQTFNWFVIGAGNLDSQYGTWTIYENMYQLQSQKMDAILYIRNQLQTIPIASSIPTVPSIIDARFHADNSNPLQDPFVRYINLNNTYLYPIHVPQSGIYNVSISYSSNSNSQPILSVFYNSNLIKAFRVNATSTSSTVFGYTEAVPVTMIRGVHVVWMRADSNRGYDIQSIKISLMQTIPDPESSSTQLSLFCTFVMVLLWSFVL